MTERKNGENVVTLHSKPDVIMDRFSNLLYQRAGISVEESKKHLLMTKIDRLLVQHRLSSYQQYWDLLQRPDNHALFQEFIDAMTTNTTSFFRENDHFEYIRMNIKQIMNLNARIRRNREFLIWSAGCSSGQESITLAMVMAELIAGAFPDYKCRILATDIDTKVLTTATNGVYSHQECSMIPQTLLSKYFTRQGSDYVVNNSLLKMISYRHFNLMDEFRFRYGFDLIFCRNVMIYFNNQTQETILNKFYDNLVPGGLFFQGHSESMVSKKHSFKIVAPTIWLKE